MKEIQRRYHSSIIAQISAQITKHYKIRNTPRLDPYPHLEWNRMSMKLCNGIAMSKTWSKSIKGFADSKWRLSGANKKQTQNQLDKFYIIPKPGDEPHHD